MKRVEIPEDELRRLYVEEELDSRTIAEQFDCSKRTIIKRLREYGIPVRPPGPPRRDDLTEELLRELYVGEELSTWEIAERLDAGRSQVHRKLKEYNIPTRDPAEAHIRYKRTSFSGDVAERAYLIGFAIGDLRVRQVGEGSKTIKADCGSTRQAQIDLFHELFSDYGRVWEGGPYENGKIQVEAFLDESFSFLLDARDQLHDTVERHFSALLAGLSDADGSFFIKDNKACFSLGTYDRELLETIKEELEKRDIIPSSISEDSYRYKTTDGYLRNDLYKQFQVHRKESLLNLVELLEPYVKHRGRNRQIERTKQNIERRNKS